MIRTITLTLTLVISVICYSAGALLLGKGDWKQGLIFAALGCILANLVTLRIEDK